MNPMLSQLNRPNWVQAFQAIKNAGNPQAMLQQALKNNPQIAQAMQNANGDPKAAFYALAKQKGIDPNEILNAIK